MLLRSKMDYGALLGKSFRDLKNNRILLVPGLLMFGAAILLMLFIGLQFLIGYLLFRGAGFNSPAIALAVIAGIIDFAIYIIILAFYKASQLGTVWDVATLGKSSFKRLVIHGKTYFWPLITYYIALLIIVLVPFALLGGITAAAFAASMTAGIAIVAIFLLLYILFSIALAVMTTFAMPIIISRKLYWFAGIIGAIKYSRANLAHTIITVLMLIAIWLVVSMVSLALYIPALIAEIMAELSTSTAVLIALFAVIIFFRILSSIASWIGGILITLFVFNSYFYKNTKKPK